MHSKPWGPDSRLLLCDACAGKMELEFELEKRRARRAYTAKALAYVKRVLRDYEDSAAFQYGLNDELLDLITARNALREAKKEKRRFGYHLKGGSR